jgi:hypothetical protein
MWDSSSYSSKYHFSFLSTYCELYQYQTYCSLFQHIFCMQLQNVTNTYKEKERRSQEGRKHDSWSFRPHDNCVWASCCWWLTVRRLNAVDWKVVCIYRQVRVELCCIMWHKSADTVLWFMGRLQIRCLILQSNTVKCHVITFNDTMMTNLLLQYEGHITNFEQIKVFMHIWCCIQEW